jgi:hypothetical protein
VSGKVIHEPSGKQHPVNTTGTPALDSNVEIKNKEHKIPNINKPLIM